MDDRAYDAADPGAAGGTAGEVESDPIRHPAPAVLDTFGRARPVTVTNAARIPGATVRVAGRAAAGPGGPLRAPLSGAECVWYRSVAFRHERATLRYGTADLRPMNPLATSDAPSYARLRAPGTTQRRADDRSSTAAFAINDGTGVIVVDPATSDVDSNVFAINEVVVVDDPSRDGNALGFGGGPFDHQELHTEWIIPVGAPLIAVGTVDTAGGTPRLVPAGQDVVLVSTKPEQQVVSRTRAAVDPSGPHLLGQRSVFLILGAVLVVALVVVATLIVLFVVPH